MTPIPDFYTHLICPTVLPYKASSTELSKVIFNKTRSDQVTTLWKYSKAFCCLQYKVPKPNSKLQHLGPAYNKSYLGSWTSFSAPQPQISVSLPHSSFFYFWGFVLVSLWMKISPSPSNCINWLPTYSCVSNGDSGSFSKNWLSLLRYIIFLFLYLVKYLVIFGIYLLIMAIIFVLFTTLHFIQVSEEEHLCLFLHFYKPVTVT